MQRTAASPSAGQRGAGWCARAAAGRGRGASASSASIRCRADRVGQPGGQLDGAGQRAGRAADLDRAAPARARSSYASRTPVSQPAALSPKVVGTACWVRVRADHRRRAVLARPGRPAGRPGRAGRRGSRATASRAQSISAVSTTSWLVRPRCSQRAASGAVPRAARGAARRAAIAGLPPRLGRPRQLARRASTPDQPAQVGLGRGRSDAGGDQCVEPGLLDGDHRLRAARASEKQVAGALVAGPEQVTPCLSVSRMGEEDGLALALEADVEAAARCRPRSRPASRGGPARAPASSGSAASASASPGR